MAGWLSERPGECLSATDVAQADLADSYVATSRTTTGLIADLASFSSIVRSAATTELAARTADKEQILATLTAPAVNGRLFVRVHASD